MGSEMCIRDRVNVDTLQAIDVVATTKEEAESRLQEMVMMGTISGSEAQVVPSFEVF